MPKAQHLVAIADAFGVTMDWLAGRIDCDRKGRRHQKRLEAIEAQLEARPEKAEALAELLEVD